MCESQNYNFEKIFRNLFLDTSKNPSPTTILQIFCNLYVQEGLQYPMSQQLSDKEISSTPGLIAALMTILHITFGSVMVHKLTIYHHIRLSKFSLVILSLNTMMWHVIICTAHFKSSSTAVLRTPFSICSFIMTLYSLYNI